ncbi:MAG TPA: AAA family ATPase, partial [Ktedonobacteraceae bacterium]|nr:AAA family ATPase [Ktedonobacteraceae bacterium]
MIGATTLLEVSTLGRFELRRGLEPLAGGNWSRRKVRDLFKLLLSVEQHRLHREQVQEILWPASTMEQAANSFGKTLYLLRRAFEPDLAAGKGSTSTYVLLDRDTLMLGTESMRIDADIFESSAKQLQVKLRNAQKEQVLLDEFDRVLALYGGDFLPEDLYEDWATRRRDRLRRVYCSLLESAADLALVSMEGQRACEYLQALLERNSADEQTHRQLMLTYARMGRRSDALNQYQLLREVLREELRATPLPETVELFRAIQAGRIATDISESRLGSGPLAGSAGTGEKLHTHAHVETDAHTSQEHQAGPEVVDEAHTGERAPVETRRDVEDELAAPSQLDPERILKATLVGREDEIAHLQRAYQQARSGQRRVSFLSGEPGVGKSRLAQEFTIWGEETQQATVLWGYCYDMSGSLPYQPLADAISAHVRMCSAEQLHSLLGNSVGDLAKIAPEIRFKLPDLPPAEPLGPEAERRNLYSAVARYFNALAAERPLIVILDDLQWADAATMQLLNFLTLQSTGASHFDSTGHQPGQPFYILLYRADEVHETHPLRGLIASLSRGGTGEELRLQRLSETQVHTLLVNMAGHDVRPAFASEIYRQTEGNPFFIGEAIRSLILEGKLKRTG